MSEKHTTSNDQPVPHEGECADKHSCPTAQLQSMIKRDLKFCPCDECRAKWMEGRSDAEIFTLATWTVKELGDRGYPLKPGEDDWNNPDVCHVMSDRQMAHYLRRHTRAN